MTTEKKATSEVFVYKAKLAEQAERYDEMAEAMKELVETCIVSDKDALSVEERNLLDLAGYAEREIRDVISLNHCLERRMKDSVAYKNAVGSRRASWRIISNIEQKESSRGNVLYASLAGEYRKKVEEELSKICHDIIALLTKNLLPNIIESESSVFYYKMKGDYFRYISEYAVEEERKDAALSAQEAYQTATETAASDLPPTHPIRLGLALNYSVFFFEILNKPPEACDMAKRAFDEAITEFDNVSEDSYKDSTLIMQLLRDNLTLWTSDMQEHEGDGEKIAGAEQ